MQHKVKNKNIKSCIYEKNIIDRFQYFTNMFFVVVSTGSTCSFKRRDAIVVECSSACFAAISDIDRNIDSYKYGRKTTAACGSDLE